MDLKLRDKIVFITGSGMGRKVALDFAAAGATNSPMRLANCDRQGMETGA